jgi:hypothetical protein
VTITAAAQIVYLGAMLSLCFWMGYFWGKAEARRELQGYVRTRRHEE